MLVAVIEWVTPETMGRAEKEWGGVLTDCKTCQTAWECS